MLILKVWLGGSALVTLLSGFDTNIFGLLAQLADADGSPVGDAFRVNQTTSSLQSGGVVFSDQGTDVTIKDYRLSNLTNDMILVQKRWLSSLVVDGATALGVRPFGLADRAS